MNDFLLTRIFRNLKHSITAMTSWHPTSEHREGREETATASPSKSLLEHLLPSVTEGESLRMLNEGQNQDTLLPEMTFM